MSIKKSPVYNVIAVPVEKVQANDYNPNVVAPPEMRLLELSIWEDGFTMPCVCYYDKEKDVYILVDGFHRYSVLKTSKRIFQRENGMLPIVDVYKRQSFSCEYTLIVPPRPSTIVLQTESPKPAPCTNELIL